MGAVPALVLCGSGGASVDGGRGIDGVRSGSGAVEALGQVVLMVNCGHDGGCAGAHGEGMLGGQAVEGIGRGRGGTHDLTQSQRGFGAVALDGRAQRGGGLEEGRGRGRELEAGAPGGAHSSGVVGRERHGCDGDGGSGGVKPARLVRGPEADISATLHGACRRGGDVGMQPGR